MPRRVIALDDTRILDRLTEREADRIRRRLWSDRES
jgi:DNA-directed RNA polymerase sigma subunit (sigma70/sigma32)